VEDNQLEFGRPTLAVLPLCILLTVTEDILRFQLVVTASAAIMDYVARIAMPHLTNISNAMTLS
jgi:hypothetical protein